MSEQPPPSSEPPCQCRAQIQEWKDKYAKLEQKFNTRKQLVALLNQALNALGDRMSKAETENDNLKKVHDQEKSHLEEEIKEKELALRVSLDNEIASLKAEISSLQKEIASGAGNGNEKATALEAKLVAGEKEIDRLKKLLKQEVSKAGSEKKNAELEKKRANETWKTTAAEKSKADEEKKVLEHKNEEYRLLVVSLKKEADEVRRMMELEKSKYAEANKTVEYEKQQCRKERKRADTERARAEEQRKLVEINAMKLMAEENRAKDLSKKVEESGKMIEMLQKKIHDLSAKANGRPTDGAKEVLGSEMAKKEKQAEPETSKAEEQKTLTRKYKRKVEDEKSRADQVSAQLNAETHRNQELQQKQLGNSWRIPVEAPIRKSATAAVEESEKLKLLKKQLKFQKEKAKHAKEVAELEKFRRCMILQDFQRAKLDFFRRLNMIDSCFVASSGDIEDPEKNGNTEMQSWKTKLYGLQPYFNHELVKPSGVSIEPPTCGGSSTDFISGIDSKMELPPGRSHRNKLKHSGINSAVASFSDRGLVGSQDKGEITVTKPTSFLEDELCQLTHASSPLNGDDRFTASEMMENNLRCPPQIDCDLVNKHGQKRKSLFDVVESVEHMCIKNRKLHHRIEERLTSVHDMLMGQEERPVYNRKYYGEKLSDDCLTTNHQKKNKDQLETEPWSLEKSCELASDVACMSTLEHGEDLHNTLINNPLGSDYPVDGEYMKWLELDNPIDEECYQVAIQRPLSPTLPEIHMEGVELINLNDAGSVHSRVHCSVEKRSPLVEATVNSMEVEESKQSFSLSEKVGMWFCNRQEYRNGRIPTFLVACRSTEDQESISRILSAIKNCLGQCSILHSGWSLKNILINLKTEEKLLPQEKACAFFSMLLLQFPAIKAVGASSDSDSIGCIESLVEHACAVIPDTDTRICLEELCRLDEFLSFIEDFLVEGKIILCSEISLEKLTRCENKNSIVLEGVNVLLSSATASGDLLVAGAVILAEFCVALDQMDFICNASYRIFRMLGSNSSLVLTILHVFALISGAKYFTLRSYSLLMTVLKSLVLFLEDCSADSACIFPGGSLRWPKCPFSDGAVSLDVLISLLLKELRNVAVCSEGLCNKVQLPSTVQVELPSTVQVEENINGPKVHEDSVINGHPCGPCLEISATTVVKYPLPEDYIDSDLFLALELIAVNLGWDGTKTKIVPKLLDILESSMPERSAAAFIILVGRLGRLGVDSSGYDDTSVEILRCHLYSFLCQACRTKWSFPIQCSIVMALLSVLPLNMESILKSTTNFPVVGSVSVPACGIRKWFFTLSKEEQALMYSLQPTVDKN